MFSLPSIAQKKVIASTSLEEAIEDGRGYSLTLEVDIPTGGTNYYVFKTPPNKVIKIKSRSISTGGGIRYEPFAGGVWTKGAELPVIRNLNALIPRPNLVKIYLADTVTSEGTSIDIVRTPSAQGSSGNPITYSADGAERVLAMDTEYLFKFDNVNSPSNDVWCIYSLVFTEDDITILDPSF